MAGNEYVVAIPFKHVTHSVTRRFDAWHIAAVAQLAFNLRGPVLGCRFSFETLRLRWITAHADLDVVRLFAVGRTAFSNRRHSFPQGLWSTRQRVRLRCRLSQIVAPTVPPLCQKRRTALAGRYKSLRVLEMHGAEQLITNELLYRLSYSGIATDR